FQEIHIDGHEKLGEKALRMGPGIGIDTYGMRDHVGKVLWLTVLPNSRLSDTIRHVFPRYGVSIQSLDFLQAIPVQVTFDGGSELGWFSAFQTTLREVFVPDLSVEDWKPVVAVKSTSNIPIESTWAYDRQLNGRSLRETLEEGRIYLLVAGLSNCMMSPCQNFPATCDEHFTTTSQAIFMKPIIQLHDSLWNV
ncbi:hypothetical protein B0H14DRAFT_2388344, partial [Mycena olivaceomarginata]